MVLKYCNNNLTKSVLILEDDVTRINIFEKRLVNMINYTITDNVEEAKKELEVNSFDKIYLDHDLDQRVFVPSNEANTGYQLAKYLVDNHAKHKETIIYIHTMNANAGKLMQTVLEFGCYRVKYIPFPILMHDFKNLDIFGE